MKINWVKEWAELKPYLFKASIESRVIWGVVSQITFGFAYYFQINSGHAPPDNPWGNPFGQICWAMAYVCWVTGGMGILCKSILGMEDIEKGGNKSC